MADEFVSRRYALALLCSAVPAAVLGTSIFMLFMPRSGLISSIVSFFLLVFFGFFLIVSLSRSKLRWMGSGA